MNLNIKRHDSSLIGCMSLSASTNFFRSEHDKQFVWHNYTEKDDKGDEMLRSDIKDKKLQRMKDTFKALAMRN